MTYIEFFAKDAAEDLCTSLTRSPEKVILIGPQMKAMRRQADRYQKVLLRRGIPVEFECRSVNPQSLSEIVQELSGIVEEAGPCAFDLTGGEDLYLVAMGIVFERYRSKGLQMHRFNLRSGTVVDCDQDGHTLFESAAPALDVDENMMIYGGDVVYTEDRPEGTFRWEMSEEFLDDIDAIWDVCRQDVRQWNAQCMVLAMAETLRDETLDPLVTMAPVPYLAERMEADGYRYFAARHILQGLYRARVLDSFSSDEHFLSVSYKNEQIKRCLLKAGQALELKIYVSALRAKEPDGSSTYNDVMTGVVIDWDGEIHPGENGYDTENEIDVVMMHGMVPVFVSCKNGAVDIAELYKLSAVAGRFGGKYARKVLVATALDSQGDFPGYFRQRAKDMQIRLVEGVQNMSEPELIRTVRSFWNQ